MMRKMSAVKALDGLSDAGLGRALVTARARRDGGAAEAAVSAAHAGERVKVRGSAEFNAYLDRVEHSTDRYALLMLGTVRERDTLRTIVRNLHRQGHYEAAQSVTIHADAATITAARLWYSFAEHCRSRLGIEPEDAIRATREDAAAEALLSIAHEAVAEYESTGAADHLDTPLWGLAEDHEGVAKFIEHFAISEGVADKLFAEASGWCFPESWGLAQ